MAAVTFEKISLIDSVGTSKAGHPVFAEGIRATVHIDSKSNVIFDFPAQNAVTGDLPPEIKLNWREQLNSWLAGQDHVSGTPVDQMPWITPAQAETLKGAGLASVEVLAECSDGILSPLGLNGSVLRTQARAWLDKASGKALADVGRLQQENEELKATLAEHAAALKELKAQKPDVKEPEDAGELEAIKGELRLMGVSFGANIGLAKARERLEEAKLEAATRP